MVLVLRQESVDHMSNAQFVVEMKEGGQPIYMVIERHGVPLSSQTRFSVREEGRPGAGRVLSGSNITAQTIVFVLHEEEVNQFPGILWQRIYGGGG
jgi:hypothetical protein